MYWIDTSDPGRIINNDKQIPFWADTVDDVQNLPHINSPGVQQGDDTVSCRPCGRGSTCTVIGDGSGAVVYALNSNDEWMLM